MKLPERPLLFLLFIGMLIFGASGCNPVYVSQGAPVEDEEAAPPLGEWVMECERDETERSEWCD